MLRFVVTAVLTLGTGCSSQSQLPAGDPSQSPDHPITRSPDREIAMPVVRDADRMARTLTRSAHEII